MNPADADPDRPWSELRQQHMSPFEVRLYRERADLEPEEAVKWWEKYVFSAEAALAVEAGLTPEQAVAQRDALRDAQHRRELEAARERQVREEQFTHGPGVVLTMATRTGAFCRVRRELDAVVVEEGAFGRDVTEVLRHPDRDEAIVSLGKYLAGGDWVVEIHTGHPDEGPLICTIQGLARAVDGFCRLDGEELDVATARSLKRMLVPRHPRSWRGYRQIDDSTWEVDGLQVSHDTEGRPMPLGCTDAPERVPC